MSQLSNRYNVMTKKQLAALIEFMATHEEVYRGKITSTFTKEIKRTMWELLANKLNGLSGKGCGKCVKSVAKWQRAWIDWKSTLKRKTRAIEIENILNNKALSPLEDEAARMIRKYDARKCDGDIDDPDELSLSDQESFSKDDSMSVMIENVRSVATENATTLQLTGATTVEVPKVKVEIPDPITDVIDTEVTDAPTLIIKDATSSVVRDIMSTAMKDVPRVVLKDIAPMATHDIAPMATHDIAPIETLGATLSGINVVHQLVTSVGKSDAVTSGIFADSAGVNSDIFTDINDTVCIEVQEPAFGERSNINSYAAMNNSYLVGIAASPSIKSDRGATSSGIKEGTSTEANDVTSMDKKPDSKGLCLSIPTNRNEKNIWEIIDKRRATLKRLRTTQTSSSSNKVRDFNRNPTLETEERQPKQPMKETKIEKECSSNISSEDTLGGLPLTLQSSILERLDTLNRNLETNTCALTILSKAVRDSANSQMRAINNLSKVISNLGNTLLNSVDRLVRLDEG